MQEWWSECLRVLPCLFVSVWVNDWMRVFCIWECGIFRLKIFRLWFVLKMPAATIMWMERIEASLPPFLSFSLSLSCSISLCLSVSLCVRVRWKDISVRGNSGPLCASRFSGSDDKMCHCLKRGRRRACADMSKSETVSHIWIYRHKHTQTDKLTCTARRPEGHLEAHSEAQLVSSEHPQSSDSSSARSHSGGQSLTWSVCVCVCKWEAWLLQSSSCPWKQISRMFLEASVE